MGPRPLHSFRDLRAYWTDEFGGDGGGPFTSVCPSGYIMVGAGATHNPVDGYVHSLSARCAPYSTSGTIGAATYEAPRGGNPYWGTPVTADCPAGQVLNGFQARSHTSAFVTGLQPICSGDLPRFKWYMGGQGGGETVLRCPVGQRAIGTVQNAEGGAINMFGLLCGPSGTPGASTPNSQITVVRGGYWHYAAWRGIGPGAEPLTSARLPANAVISRCDDSLLGISGRVDNVVQHIGSIWCSEGSNLMYKKWKTVNVGSPNDGYYRAQQCSLFKPIDGIYIRNGWLTDGFSIHCAE